MNLCRCQTILEMVSSATIMGPPRPHSCRPDLMLTGQLSRVNPCAFDGSGPVLILVVATSVVSAACGKTHPR